MKYVYVTSIPSSIEQLGYEEASINLTGKALTSLIAGLRQKSFGYDSVERIALRIREFSNLKICGKEFDLYIDSGGYSIIQGDVPFNETKKCIQSYHEYLKYHYHDFDCIFSLDIPLWGGDDQNNTPSNLYEYNKASIISSLELLDSNPSLTDKFFFVWHFKALGQYSTWVKIIDEVNLIPRIRNWAIGGLVSIRERAPRVDFTCFIPLAFKCLADHIQGPFSDGPFKLHILGINLAQDRFHLALIEHIFQRLCPKLKIEITYDTINPTVKGVSGQKTMQVDEFHDGQLTRHQLRSIPARILTHVYFNEELHNGILKEFKRLNEGTKLSDSAAFVPLQIYSMCSIDNYFEHLIVDNHLPNIICAPGNKIQKMKKLSLALNDLKLQLDSYVTRSVFDEMENSLGLVCDSYQWYTNGADQAQFHELMDRVIERIGFPSPF